MSKALPMLCALVAVCAAFENMNGDYLPLQDTPQQKLLHKRRCTDCCCCLVFLLAIGVASLIAAAAVQVGNPRLLTHGKDYTGRLCGLDRGVMHLPKLYYPRLAEDLIE